MKCFSFIVDALLQFYEGAVHLRNKLKCGGGVVSLVGKKFVSLIPNLDEFHFYHLPVNKSKP